MYSPILKQIALELTLKYLVNDYVKFNSVCMKKPLMMLGMSNLCCMYVVAIYIENFSCKFEIKSSCITKTNRIIESK